MIIKRSELIHYLLKEQGYDEEEVKKMSTAEILDLYEMYHEY